MNCLNLPCEIGQVSDGYHTFDELYEHRNMLFISLLRSMPKLAWRARHHSDGTMFEGFFVAGLRLESGMITYHVPSTLWKYLDYSRIATLDKAPEWDGHTAQDVINRMKAEIESDTEIKKLHLREVGHGR